MTDEKDLTGFLDRELDPVDHAEVEARAKRDPDTAARLVRLRANDDLLRAAFASPTHEGVPDRFAAVIDAGLANAPLTSLHRRAHRPGNDNQPRWWHLGGAVAASLAIGVVLSMQLVPGASDATMSASLSTALSATPSLQTVTLATGERMTPQLTLAQNGGGYCRQFRLASASREMAGVACRSKGPWSVEALVPAGSNDSAQQGYVTAEGAEPSALDGVINSRRAGDPLAAAAETALIARDWR